MSAIASQLGLSVKTVETYRARIIKKLDVRRLELITLAVEWKLTNRAGA